MLRLCGLNILCAQRLPTDQFAARCRAAQDDIHEEWFVEALCFEVKIHTQFVQWSVSEP